MNQMGSNTEREITSDRTSLFQCMGWSLQYVSAKNTLLSGALRSPKDV